jgi:Protein of unknown function (DUF2911)
MLRRKVLCSLGGLLLGALITYPLSAQTGDAKKPASPPEKASVELNGKTVTIDYSAPSMRGRKIKGGLVPFGKVWRTGANAATTLKTPVDLKIGGLTVPAGTYTLYSLPTENDWTLIINKQTGQWGTQYDEKQDLGRVPLQTTDVNPTVETFKIHFEKTNGAQTELHLTWENSDGSVPVVAQ